MWTSETIELLFGNPVPKMYREVSDPNSQETLGQLSKVSPPCKERLVFDSHCGSSGWNILFSFTHTFPILPDIIVAGNRVTSVIGLVAGFLTTLNLCFLI